VDGQARHQDEAAALHELRPAPAPLVRLLDGKLRAVEEHPATGVGDAPIIAFAGPFFHLRPSHLGRIVDQRGEHPRLVKTGRPEFSRQRMIPPVLAGDLPQDRRANAEVFTLGSDAIAALALDVAGIAQRAQVGDDFRGGVHSL
jgi:hypothetical protein